jgi:hypothetical protein
MTDEDDSSDYSEGGRKGRGRPSKPKLDGFVVEDSHERAMRRKKK